MKIFYRSFYIVGSFIGWFLTIRDEGWTTEAILVSVFMTCFMVFGIELVIKISHENKNKSR